ncbi:MAG TPA: type I restriction enzyme HsdR N-terminal domain-containing protein [Chlamydiales bacterium]|nr:type I restriction enzyme HsdR N-terminal domain-containing protein [Chlamydiales bacterium]
MIWDPIRGLHVEATPEEKIRQKWISAMIGPLGYPRGLLSVEKGISQLKRRADIICYTPGKEGLVPLLIIECKAEDEGIVPEKQILGYNSTIQAPFLCIIQGDKVKTFWKENENLASVPFLPAYSQLIFRL